MAKRSNYPDGVNFSNPNHSRLDLSHLHRSSFDMGKIIPIDIQAVMPGDSFDIDLSADVKTYPTLGALFGSFKLQLDVFSCPVRLYQGMLHNNKLGIGMNMASIKLPT